MHFEEFLKKMHLLESYESSMHGSLLHFVYLSYMSALHHLRCHNISSNLE